MHIFSTSGQISLVSCEQNEQFKEKKENIIELKTSLGLI